MKPHAMYTVSVTPFAADGSLDEAGLRRHVRRLADAGLWIYLAGSGTGEGNSLTEDEMERVFVVAVAEVKGKVPVRAAGIEHRTARDAIRHAEIARRCGVDAFQVYGVDLGHNIQPSAAELERYLSDVLDAVRMPVVLTSHAYLGYVLPLPLIEKLLARYPNVVGLICNSADFGYVTRLLDRFSHLPVHLGRPEVGFSALALGATGFGLAEGNVAPELVADFVRAYDAGDLAAAQARFEAILRLYAAFLMHANVRGVKAALAHLGLPGGGPRPPRLPLSTEETAQVALAVEGARKRFPELVGC